MSFSQELVSEKYLKDYAETAIPDTMTSAPAAKLSPASFACWTNVCAVLAVAGACATFWLLQPSAKTKSHPAADFLLWVTGSKLTWAEYQQQQRNKGNQRLDETQYDWQQQLLNDAYSRPR